MAQPDIIVTAPLPPFLYEPLKADYRCHDYYQASHKPALLAAEGPRIRGLVQGGGTVTPTSLLDALPKLEIISVFGVGYDGVPVDYCRKRGIKVTNTPDVLTDDVADVALAPHHDDGPRLRARSTASCTRASGRSAARSSRPSSPASAWASSAWAASARRSRSACRALGMQVSPTRAASSRTCRIATCPT